MNSLAIVLIVQCLMLTGLLIWSQRITRKALALLDIEMQLAQTWAMVLSDFSAMRVDFGDTEAIKWLDAETGPALDKIRRLLDQANQIK